MGGAAVPNRAPDAAATRSRANKSLPRLHRGTCRDSCLIHGVARQPQRESGHADPELGHRDRGRPARHFRDAGRARPVDLVRSGVSGPAHRRHDAHRHHRQRRHARRLWLGLRQADPRSLLEHQRSPRPRSSAAAWRQAESGGRIRVVEGGEVDHLFRPRWPRVGASEIVNAWPIMKNDGMAANMQQFIEGIKIMVFLREMPFFADLVGREPERRRKIVTAWPIMKMTLCCQNAAVHRRH